MFMLSFLEIPVGVRKRLDFLDHNFFGNLMALKRIIG
jgi:hypothetical protein